MNKFKVYLIRDRKTLEIKYVGLTRQNLEKRFTQHASRKNFNKKDYTIELISEDLTIEQAVELEKLLIKQYDLINNGWNVSPGSINGSSNYHTEEMKQKWSKERKGIKVSEEHAAKNRIARLGHKNTPEQQRKIVEKVSKPVICLETGIIYRSARHAAKELNLNYSKISLVCNGKRSTTGGLHFKFVMKR